MLPRPYRLTQKADFENVKQNGKFVASRLFTISYVKRDSIASLQNDTHSRFGFIVSKKISTKAHERNRVKRVLREIVRKNLESVKSGIDVVIIVKVGIIHAAHATIEIELKKAFRKIGLMA